MLGLVFNTRDFNKKEAVMSIVKLEKKGIEMVLKSNSKTDLEEKLDFYESQGWQIVKVKVFGKMFAAVIRKKEEK